MFGAIVALVITVLMVTWHLNSRYYYHSDTILPPTPGSDSGRSPSPSPGPGQQAPLTGMTWADVKYSSGGLIPLCLVNFHDTHNERGEEISDDGGEDEDEPTTPSPSQDQQHLTLWRVKFVWDRSTRVPPKTPFAPAFGAGPAAAEWDKAVKYTHVVQTSKNSLVVCMVVAEDDVPCIHTIYDMEGAVLLGMLRGFNVDVDMIAMKEETVVIAEDGTESIPPSHFAMCQVTLV